LLSRRDGSDSQADRRRHPAPLDTATAARSRALP
jgi:hypothetical protein